MAPVIMLTGHAAYETDLEASDLGVTDYLVKHELDPSSLERSIRYAINHHKAVDLSCSEERCAWIAQLRETDLLARYGGEEFIVALPDCPPTEADRALSRLRNRVPNGQTCSIGVATWDRHEPGKSLVARADTALYQAKRAGRDRIVSV